jgi:transposase
LQVRNAQDCKKAIARKHLKIYPCSDKLQGGMEMLTMTQVDSIRKMYYEQGESISEISRITGNDRRTVRKYVGKDDWNPSPPDPAGKAEYPKLEPFKAEINGWLEDDRHAKRKQRHTATRVYHRLIEAHGAEFNCSYRTVAGYVAEKKKEIYGAQSGFLPLEHPAGEAQADFGDAQFYENGHLCDGKYLNVSFPYSNHGYLQLFPGENQECLFEGMRAVFEHIGGVPYRIWFDNTSTIVTKILKDGGRNLTDGFLRFQAHYRFESTFCNPEAGHEKGNVESKVGYHRRNLLVPVPRFDSLAEYNRELLERCDKDAKREHYRKDATIEELFQDDQAALLELPKNLLDVSRYITVKTNGYGKFFLNGGLHEYSVSPKYAKAAVLLRLTSSEVIVLDENEREIVRHRRLYGKQKQESMQWLPYLTQLSRNPGALKYTGIYQMLPASVQSYLEQCVKPEKGKVLKAIAKLTESGGFEEAVKTVDSALTYGAFNGDSLIGLSERLFHNLPAPVPIRADPRFPVLPPVTGGLAQYDAGLGKQGGSHAAG